MVVLALVVVTRYGLSVGCFIRNEPGPIMILIHCREKGEQAELARRLEEVKSRQGKMERKADMIDG